MLLNRLSSFSQGRLRRQQPKWDSGDEDKSICCSVLDCLTQQQLKKRKSKKRHIPAAPPTEYIHFQGQFAQRRRAREAADGQASPSPAFIHIPQPPSTVKVLFPILISWRFLGPLYPFGEKKKHETLIGDLANITMMLHLCFWIKAFSVCLLTD